jgi:hypothetical protein
MAGTALSLGMYGYNLAEAAQSDRTGMEKEFAIASAVLDPFGIAGLGQLIATPIIQGIYKNAKYGTQYTQAEIEASRKKAEAEQRRMEGYYRQSNRRQEQMMVDRFINTANQAVQRNNQRVMALANRPPPPPPQPSPEQLSANQRRAVQEGRLQSLTSASQRRAAILQQEREQILQQLQAQQTQIARALPRVVQATRRR